MVSSARGGGLKRELGPLTATLFTAGMMVGIGIFATFGAATEAAGSGILVRSCWAAASPWQPGLARRSWE